MIPTRTLHFGIVIKVAPPWTLWDPPFPSFPTKILKKHFGACEKNLYELLHTAVGEKKKLKSEKL